MRDWQNFRLGLIGIVGFLLASCQAPLRYNEIQFVGSHNSYKVAIEPAVMEKIAESNRDLAASLDYSHLPLQQQLDLGMRKLEIDLLYDPMGGLFAKPFGVFGLPDAMPYDSAIMKQPGFKVMHIQDIDFRSHCPLLTQCLDQISQWSAAHPRHIPIVITINAKDDAIDLPGFTTPLKFDDAAWAALDKVFYSKLAGRLFSPDDFRGEFGSLPEAVAAGWPLLDELRGRVIVVLDHQGKKLADYIEGHPGLEGRAMFVNAIEDTPEAAIRIVNDPIKEFDYIQQLVKRGYIVRTRADADTLEARSGDTARRDKAFESGAQIISTDYYVTDERFSTGYLVTLPGGGVARCNPVLLPDCKVKE